MLLSSPVGRYHARDGEDGGGALTVSALARFHVMVLKKYCFSDRD